MEIIQNIEDFCYPDAVVTVGTFDGVHLGHKKILTRLVAEAKKINGTPVVFTLKPHPRKVLFPNQTDLAMLNSSEEKNQRLNDAGVAVLVEYPFTREFSNLSSCDFIEEILHKKLKIKKLIIGYDHRFGKDRQGDPEILKACAAPFGFDVIKVDAYKAGQTEISSTRIRKAIEAGEIETANQYLGYPYAMKGKVVEGTKIGRTLGFPTANIEPDDPEKMIPKKGAYAVNVILKNKTYKGMLNIGTRPTVNDRDGQTIEVHLFDFEGDIYGETITVFLKSYIREERKFTDTDELKRQLETDKEIINKSIND